MPNVKNVESPISLIGLGRSGTSVLQAALDRHTDVQVCGETFGLIAGLWAGGSTTYLANDVFDQQKLGIAQPDKVPLYVRETFCHLCPSNKSRWFHKPIGMPKFLNWRLLPGDKSPITGFPPSWYWQILDDVFPAALYLTTVRSPWDVLLSRQEFSGWSLQGMALDVAFTYELYAMAGDRLKQTIFFEDLVGDPAQTLKKLCETVQLDYQPAMLQAFEKSHAAVQGRGPKRDHRDRWRQLKGVRFHRASIDQMIAFWKSHGRELEIPDGIAIKES